jgi:glutamyl-tRNA reductase
MLLFAGLSHHRAPLALRERCAVPPEERPRVQTALRRRLGAAVVLSTCGRVELYADHPDPDAGERALREWLAARARLAPAELLPYLETARGEGAVRRVVRVACGLESAVEGEDEVLGQVRRAWLDAGHAGALSAALDAAFRLAVRAGRQARRIGDGGAWTSLADSAAAHVALGIEGLSAPRVVLAGSGPMGVRAARALRERFGPTLGLALAGRTPARVAAHAARLGAEALTLADIPRALAEADAAVVGLRTSRPLIGPADVTARSAARPLLLVDLSVPRAVDGAVAALPHVTLRTVDDLAGEGGPSRWDAEARARVETLVERTVGAFGARAGRSETAATLAALRMQAEGTRRALLARTLRRLPDLDAEARWTIDALTRALVNRLLHVPTLRLKAGDDDRARAARALFGLDGLDHEPTARADAEGM